ncbi:MAG: hypothetical protein FWG70_06220 [Oscillospiraceae bacterium]|nr:hypothetical protein [Oscillospiraceae bacterium]
MTDFTGASCPICEKTFNKNERPVVCTYCGAPYHRECYERQGFCAYTDAHQSGYAWERPSAHVKMNIYPDAPEIPKSADSDDTPFSENKQNNGDLYSGIMDALEKIGLFGMSDNETISSEERFIFGVSEKELAHFHGGLDPMRLLRYRRIASGRKISPNIFAFLFSPFYMFYTRMRAVGVLIMLITFLLTLPTVLSAYFFDAPEVLPFTRAELEQAMSAFGFFNFSLTLFIGLFFDYFHLRWAAHKIKLIRSRFAPDALSERPEIPDAPSIAEKLTGLDEDYYNCLQAVGRPGFRHMLLDSLAAMLIMVFLYNTVINVFIAGG